jgi:adenosine deaminase
MSVTSPPAEHLVIPTVELHRHFEAGLRPALIARLAEKNGVSSAKTRAGEIIEGVDPQDPASIERYYREVAAGFAGPGGFARFIDSFGLPLSVLQSLEDLEAAAFDQLVDLAEHGSLHAELRGSPVTYTAIVPAPVDEILNALTAGVARAWTERRVSGTFIAAFSRQNGLGAADGPVTKRQAPIVADAVARRFDADRPVGMDIAGFPEDAYPPHLFERALAPAREAGVPLTVHCGEQGRWPDFAAAPPSRVLEAVEVLGARRIGHGTCLIQDADIRAALRERGVGIECCPRSNVMMGFIPALDHHPLRAFLDDGMLASVATDDPLMFGDFTVAELLDDTAAALGLDDEARFALAENGLKTAFVSDARRTTLLESLRARRAAAAA